MIIKSHRLLQVPPSSQPAHPFWKDLAAGLTLLGLAFCFGEISLINSGNEAYTVDDVRITADFMTYSESL